MGITDEHYQLVRKHFFELLGSKCQCNENCGFSDFSKIHFHHKNGNGHILNGESGRGREVRMWELFKAFKENNLMLLSPKCHEKTDTYAGKNNR